METLATLTARHAQDGRLDWIGLRPKRLADIDAVASARLSADGLEGDHARPGKRTLTLIQAEHLPVIAAIAGRPALEPHVLRRNLVVSKLNLQALRGKQIRIGDAVIELTIPCAPCSRMEAALGPGGYTAMRGHGGWCARVITPGLLTIGAAVTPA
ncbi:MOSC domain-containing protein [Jannaschia sp. CCS1]|uniref:MOSC domain-containing protein n=1 Tax=Jannaschia sp. (strain CCS1) TaxID=290400 RepID=UPI000053BFFA|nr:MOSC domain-containing protein [Jannaschia sp. CCS1]ABD53275.1 MOSC [Jannaschia sp. CCS1]